MRTSLYLSIDAVFVVEERQLLSPKPLHLYSGILYRLSIAATEFKLNGDCLTQTSKESLK